MGDLTLFALPLSFQATLRKIVSGGQTGVEMEALTAVSVAALTIYDMCKAYDREMTISDIQLMHKSGGKSGVLVHPSHNCAHGRRRPRSEFRVRGVPRGPIAFAPDARCWHAARAAAQTQQREFAPHPKRNPKRLKEFSKIRG